MATAKSITLKRYNGTDYDPLYPKTTGQQVFDSTLTTPLLDGSNKIQDTFLPSYIFGGMRYAGALDAQTLGANFTLSYVANTIAGWITGSSSDPSDFLGSYFIIVVGDDLAGSNTADANGFKYLFEDGNGIGYAPLPEDFASIVSAPTESGDWVVFNRYDSGTKTLYFSIVNNTYRLASTTANGIMSSTDKTKLDGIAANANNYTHPSYTTRSVDTTGVDVLDTFTSDSTGHVTGIGTRTLPNATTSAAGVMSAADKTKLDGIATGANLYVLPTAAANTLGGIEVGYTSTETNRAVSLSGNDAYVNLPRQIPAVTLNGSSSTSPSFYSATTGGLNASTTQRRQFLEANGTGAAPTWVDAPRMLYEDTEAAATSTGVFLGDILFEF